jgi:hypothetical protein
VRNAARGLEPLHELTGMTWSINQKVAARASDEIRMRTE